MRVNEDVLWRISLYIAPDMAVYTRLAAVNRTFYAVFTSDKLWSEINPYGVEQNIFESMGTTPLDRKLLRYYLVNGDRSTEPLTYRQLKVLTQNQFVWLAYILGCFYNADYFTEYRSLIDCAVNLHYSRDHATTVEPEFLRTSKEWALKLIAQWPWLYPRYGRANQFYCDVDLFTVGASVKHPDFTVEPCMRWIHFSHLRKEGPVVELALQRDPRNIAYVSDGLREKYASNREWVLGAVELFPFLLEYLGKYADDEEVVQRAFSKPLQYELLEDDSKAYLKHVSGRLRRNHAVCKQATLQHFTNLRSSRADDIEILKSTLRRMGPGDRDNATSFMDSTDYEGNPIMPKLPKAQEIYSQFDHDPEAQILLAQCSEEYFESEEFLAKREQVIEVLKCPQLAHMVYYTKNMYGSDPSFYLTVMENNKSAETFVNLPTKMQENRDIALKALELGTPIEDIEQVVGPIFSTRRECVKLALSLIPQGKLFSIPAKFADDQEIVEMAVAKRGCALKYASKRLQSLPELIEHAFDTQAHVEAGSSCVCMPYKWVDSELLQARIADLSVLAGDCPSRYFVEDAIALSTFRSCPSNYRLVSDTQKASREFNLRAASVNGATLRFMDEKFWRDKEILEAANLEYTCLYISSCPQCFE